MPITRTHLSPVSFSHESQGIGHVFSGEQCQGASVASPVRCVAAVKGVTRGCAVQIPWRTDGGPGDEGKKGPD